jgi:hypothetical protein
MEPSDLSKDLRETPTRSRPGRLTWLPLLGLFIAIAVLLTLLLQPIVRLQWVTENELDVTGYNVYRSESEGGPFVQLNDGLLPPATDPVVGGNHQYVDESVRWGRSYFYQLETVDRRGNRSRSSSIRLRPRLEMGWP